MTNKTITLSREAILLVAREMDRLGYGHHESHAESLLCAALEADPVPPTGGDVEAMPQHRSWSGIASWKQRAEINAWNAACDAWEPHATRLQAEVERLGKRVEEEVATAISNELKSEREVLALQSELTKARELFTDLKESAARSLPDHLYSRIYEFLVNQSTPADKGQAVVKMCDCNQGRLPCTCRAADKGQGEPVARDQQVTELAEFMGRLSGGLRHFAGQIIDAGWTMRSTPSAIPVGFRDPEFSWATISAENKARMEGLGHDLSCFSESLYAEQPAPVAVVMPERLAIQSHWPEWKISGSEGWNACLDELARLNPIKQ